MLDLALREKHICTRNMKGASRSIELNGTPESKLTPGRHAIHIHETGNCEPFSSAKGHFDGNEYGANPQANVSPGLGNHPYHLGDLQNLSVDNSRKGRCIR